MKKNDRELMKDFRSSYFMCINDFEGVSEDKAIEADPGEYFGEYPLYFDLCVPISKEGKYIEFHKLRFSYEFQLYFNDNGKYDVTFNDINRPRVHLFTSYADSIIDAIGTSDVYFSEFTGTSFSNFAMDSVKELDKYFKNIDEQFFFDFQVKKKNVILSKNLLNQLQKNFYNDLVSFVEKIEAGDYKTLAEKYEMDVKSIEKLAEAVKLAEVPYYYNKLKDELPENTKGKSTKMPKI